MLPVFMFGMERSGTTILSLMVGAHPRIAVPYPVSGMWYELAKTNGPIEAPMERGQVNRLVQQLLDHRRITDWDVDLDQETIFANMRGSAFKDVLCAVYETYASCKGKEHWVQMDINNLDHLTELNGWFPDARFVHIVRDGRDVALSNQTMPYGAGNIAECAHSWNLRVAKARAIGSVLHPERFHELKYEDLVLDPEAVLRSLCSFLHVEYSPKMLAYRSLIDEKVPKDREWLWPNLREPLDHNKVAQWKRNMTPTQRIVFEEIAGALLGELGYETLEKIPRSIRAELLLLFYQINRGGRMKRLKNRLGLNSRTPLEPI